MQWRGIRARKERPEGATGRSEMAMARWRLGLAAAIVAAWCGGAAAQELVRFASYGDNGSGPPATTLDGYLFRPAGEGQHPAVVFLHGCSGMFARGR